MNIAIYVLMIIQLGLTAYFSLRARRHRDPLKRGLNFARMNIMIGVLFLTLSLAQLFTAPFRNLFVAFAILVLLIGLYNLFVGIRNHITFSQMIDAESQQVGK